MSYFDDLFSLFDAVTQGPAPQLARDLVDDLIVSTVNTYDCGYETAILDATGDAYPVERYESHDEALEGHAQWVERVPGLTEVTRLGYGTTVADKTVKLRRS